MKKILPGKRLDIRMTPPELMRFLDKVQHNRNTDCWEWTAHKDAEGYGRIKLRGKTQWAHRVAFAEWIEPIPAGMEINHIVTCLNRSCVNPDHLQLMTPGENRADANRRTGYRGKRNDDTAHEVPPI